MSDADADVGVYSTSPLGLWAVWRLLSFCIFVAVGGKPIVGAAR